MRRDALEEQNSQEAEEGAISTYAIDIGKVLLMLRLDVRLAVLGSSLRDTDFGRGYEGRHPFFKVDSDSLAYLVKWSVLT